MRLLRSAIGPLGIGAAVWCAASPIAPAAPGLTTPRYGVPAPWWIFVAATALAAIAPQIRRRPIVALPALLSTLAWWPAPVPPIALIFTGPLAWLPIAVAIVMAVGVAPIGAIGRALGAERPSRAPWLAALAALVLVTAAAWSAAPQSPGGDEPHYLVITQSLLKDGDLLIENNHRQQDYKAYYGGNLEPHYLVRGQNGQIYSVHAPGLSTIVLPGFALAGYRGAEATVILLAAVTSALVWLIGWHASGDLRAAWFAWAAIVTSATFLIQGFTIYPDGPAMLAVAVGTWLLLRLGDAAAAPAMGTLVTASIPLAVLPWLHTRFSVIAAGFGVSVALRLLADRTRPFGARVARVAAFVFVPAIGAAAWFAFFKAIYGTFSPTAPYGATAGNQIQYIPGGTLALLFDGQFGLATYAPALVAAAAGWWTASRGSVRRTGLETLCVLVLYLAATTTYWMWWAGGPAPPARFFAAMLPVLAVPLAMVWLHGDRLRHTALVALVGVGCGFSFMAIASANGAVAWNNRDAQSRVLEWLGPVVNLRRAWPAFFWTLAPDFDVHNLGSEWRFAGYVALFFGGFFAWWLALRAIARRRGDADPNVARAIVGAWLLVGLMLVAQSGWIANRVDGLDPELAQARLLTAVRRGDAVVAILPGHWSRKAASLDTMTIARQEPGKFLNATPAFLASHLPAGDYLLRLSLDRPISDTITVAAGDTRSTFVVRTADDRNFSLHVAQDDSSVVVAADAIQAAGGVFVLSPRIGNR